MYSRLLDYGYKIDLDKVSTTGLDKVNVRMRVGKIARRFLIVKEKLKEGLHLLMAIQTRFVVKDVNHAFNEEVADTGAPLPKAIEIAKDPSTVVVKQVEPLIEF